MTKNIFIINLARSTDRKQRLEPEIAKLQKCGIAVEFSAAVDAKQQGHLKYEDHYNALLTKCFLGRELTEGERGCFASHYSLWEKCVEMNRPIVIMEDDVHILDDFAEGLDRIYDSNYEYVRLIVLRERNILTLRENFGITYAKVTGTQGYFLTPKAAKKFMSKAGLWLWPVDLYMDKSYIHKVPNIIHVPYLIKASNEIRSVIGKRKPRRNVFFTVIRYSLGLLLEVQKVLYMRNDKVHS